MLLKRLSLILVCFCLLLCSSCGQREIDTERILGELLPVAGDLPQGEIYRSDAEEGCEGFLAPTLRDVLYGEDSSECFALLEGYAIYLSSFAYPCEIGVFCLRSASDADRITAMCLERADTLRVLLRETEFSKMAESIRVICRGRLVIMGLVADAARFESEAYRLS